MAISRCRMDRVLVSLDGSRPSARVVTYAGDLVRPTGEVSLLHVSPLPVQALNAPIDELRRAADRLRLLDTGVGVQVRVASGDPADETLRAAADFGAELIVMACEGKETAGLGGAVDRVARSSPVPLLIVRDRESRTTGISSAIRRIVVPLDGSDRAMEGLEVAEGLAMRLGAPVLLLSVIDQSEVVLPTRRVTADARLDAQRTLDRASASVMRYGIGLHSMLLSGAVASTIANATAPGDIVVMTRQGRGGRRSPVGSVAERLIATSPVPVVLVPVRRAAEIVIVTLDDVLRGDPIGAA